MRKSLIQSLAVVGAMTMPLLCAAPAQAQFLRTWVSGVGDDNNAWTRTMPRLTFIGAISKTAPGGEIDALDPGGFGAVTINKSITIDGGGGQVASAIPGPQNAIVIAAQPNDVVVIRNLRLQGLLGLPLPGQPGLDGILWQSGGRLIIDNCDITGFTNNGIEIAGPGFVAIHDTRIENVGAAGIVVDSAATATVKVDNVHVYAAKWGFAATNGNEMLISHSEVSAATTAGVQADPGSIIVLNNSDISFSVTGINGPTQSFNNNRVVFNISPGTTPTIAPTATPNPNGMK